MEYPIHYATFNGKHNATKSRCFIVLYLNGGYLRPREVRQLVGMNRVFLDRWHRMNYLVRRMGHGRGTAHFVYALSLRGRRFVTERIPPEKYEEYLTEIKEHQEKILQDNKFVRDWYNSHFRNS